MNVDCGLRSTIAVRSVVSPTNLPLPNFPKGREVYRNCGGAVSQTCVETDLCGTRGGLDRHELFKSLSIGSITD